MSLDPRPVAVSLEGDVMSFRRLAAPILSVSASALIALAALPASAHPITFLGTLSNAGEAPPANMSSGTGFVSLILDDDTFSLTVHAIFSGLTGTTTASHIHCCTAAAGSGNAGVATPVPSFPGFPLGVTQGTYDHVFDMTQASSWNPAFVSANGGTISSAFAAFSTGLNGGKAYYNIHTTFATGGEIRTFPLAVPEPATAALLALGIGVLARARRTSPIAV
jgi:hypothetical protein